MQRRDEVVVALPVLVVDRNPPVEQLAQFGWPQWLFKLDGEECLDLVEQEAAVAVGAGDQRVACLRSEGEVPLLEHLGTADQLLECSMVEATQDQHLAARQQSGVDLEARV